MEIFSPPRFFLSHFLCFESLLTCSQPWAFSPVLFSHLLTTRDPEFHRTGVTSWPAGSQVRGWSREKDRRRAKRSPRRRVPVCRCCHLRTGRKRHQWHTPLSPSNQLIRPLSRRCPPPREHNSPSCKGARPRRKQRRTENIR